MSDVITLSGVRDALEDGGWQPRPQSDGSYRAKCPAHDGGDHNLSVTEKIGKVLLTCHSKGCTYQDVLSALNLHNGIAWTKTAPAPARAKRPGKVVATYRYDYEDGSHAFDVLRYDHPKTFRPRLPNGKMQALRSPRPMYRLPEIGDGEITILEGEKDTDKWREVCGTPATTYAGGNKAWDKTDWAPIHGRKVLLVADADEAGHDAFKALAAHLVGKECTVEIALPPVGWKAKAVGKKDFSDWVERLGPNDAHSTVTELRAPFAAEDKPFPHRDAAVLEAVLETLKIELRYNLRRQQPEMRKGGMEGEWCQFTDLSTAKMRRIIAERFTYKTHRGTSPLRYGRQTWTEHTDAILEDLKVDPFLEWLAALPPWDEIERLDKWLRDAFEVDETNNPDVVAWVSRFVFLGAVWRAYEPGTKLDEMPVLVGRQGIGKSTALRLALPPDQPELFADGLHLAAQPHHRAEALQGRVIVEVAEMAGTNRAELESLKAFLSRVDDGGVRLAYRRDPEPAPRRAIIVGTTNDPRPLPNDPSGNRRFVVIKLTGGDVADLKAYMDGARNQLWAEAVSRYDQRETAWLPAVLKAAQAEVNEGSRRRDDILEDTVEGWLGEGEAMRSGFTMDELIDGIRRTHDDLVSRSGFDQRRVGAILERRGLKKSRPRINGKKRTVWT